LKYPAVIWNKIFSIEGLVILYFFLLLLFGKTFTKFQVAGPLYLHDLYLGVLTLIAINNRKKLTLRFVPVLIIIGLAFIYLVFSLAYYHPTGEMLTITFRQFNLIVYLLCSYLLFNLLVKDISAVQKIISLILYLSKASVILQIVFIVYGYLFINNFSLFEEGEYNYFSPLIIFGIITYAAVALAYEEKISVRFLKFLGALVLSTTLGHSSAFLAIFCIGLLYFFMRIKPMQRLVAVGIIFTVLLVLLLLPQFRDANAGWRVLYWGHVLKEAVVSKYTVLGSGFGRPFMSYDFAVYINETIHSAIMIDEYYPMARYLSPPHNSWLSFVFHIGLLPALLFLLPLKNVGLAIMLSPLPSDRNKLFLLLAFAGCAVWVSFNVILELPHSATYFWLVYFTTAYAFRDKSMEGAT
jgi:hypothetical protein